MIAAAALLAPFALAVCDADLVLNQTGEAVSIEVTGEAGEGPVPCRSIVLGQANQVQIQRLKATINHWDDTRTVVRQERRNRLAGQ